MREKRSKSIIAGKINTKKQGITEEKIQRKDESKALPQWTQNRSLLLAVVGLLIAGAIALLLLYQHFSGEMNQVKEGNEHQQRIAISLNESVGSVEKEMNQVKSGNAAINDRVHDQRRVFNSLNKSMGSMGKEMDRVNTENDDQRRAVKSFNEIVGSLEKVVSGLQAKIVQLERRIYDIKAPCLEGFNYKGKCYFSVVENVRDKASAEKLCIDNAGRLSDILDGNHQTMFETDTRGKANNDRYYWTAITYQPSGRTVRLTDGNQIASSSFRWRSGYPYLSRTGMKILVSQDESSSENGLYNIFESSRGAGALCQKED